MKKPPEVLLVEVVEKLQRQLGENLASCCVYGSAARGNAVEGVSDLNLLLVLERSDAVAHDTIGTVLADFPEVDPFVVARTNLARTARCFATKFASIRRNHRVLAGKDLLPELALDPAVERLLCEQALRNLRLRLTYARVMHGRQRNYGRFLTENVPGLFVQLSDVLRLGGLVAEVPRDFAARIPLMQAAWRIEPAALHDLLRLRAERGGIAEKELDGWHQRLLEVLDAALAWIEAHWSANGTTSA